MYGQRLESLSLLSGLKVVGLLDLSAAVHCLLVDGFDPSSVDTASSFLSAVHRKLLVFLCSFSFLPKVPGVY